MDSKYFSHSFCKTPRFFKKFIFFEVFSISILVSLCLSRSLLAFSNLSLIDLSSFLTLGNFWLKSSTSFSTSSFSLFFISNWLKMSFSSNNLFNSFCWFFNSLFSSLYSFFVSSKTFSISFHIFFLSLISFCFLVIDSWLV